MLVKGQKTWLNFTGSVTKQITIEGELYISLEEILVCIIFPLVRNVASQADCGTRYHNAKFRWTFRRILNGTHSVCKQAFNQHLFISLD